MSDDALIRRESLRAVMKARALTIEDLQAAVGGRYTYWRDLLNTETKSFGEKVARKIEEKLGLQRGYLDQPPAAPANAEADPVTDSTERDERDDIASAVHWLAELLQAASPMARKAAAPVLAGIAESPDAWHEAADMLATLLSSHSREHNPGTGDAPNAETGRTIATSGGQEWRRKAGTQPQEASKQSSRRRRA